MAFDNLRGRALAIKTASEITDTSESQIYRWGKDGEIKLIKLSYRLTRVDGDSLADLLTRRMSEPRPPRGKAAAKNTLSELAAQA